MSRKVTISASTHAEKAVPDTLSLALIRSDLTNAQDEDVLKELEKAQFGKLAVDRFAPMIRASGESDEAGVGRLRREVRNIYLRAARKRAQKRASAEQLRRAEQALQSFEKGIKHLEAALWLAGEKGVPKHGASKNTEERMAKMTWIAQKRDFNPEGLHELGVAFENCCAAIPEAKPPKGRETLAMRVINLVTRGRVESTQLYLGALLGRIF
jgi:hypothetical protein